MGKIKKIVCARFAHLNLRTSGSMVSGCASQNIPWPQKPKLKILAPNAAPSRYLCELRKKEREPRRGPLPQQTCTPASFAVNDRGRLADNAEDILHLVVNMVDLGDSAVLHRRLERRVALDEADDAGRRGLADLGGLDAVVDESRVGRLDIERERGDRVGRTDRHAAGDARRKGGEADG